MALTCGGEKMAIEAWSDIMCPYCYMGKQMLRSALAEFPYRDRVQIFWKSFQLEPTLRTEDRIDTRQFLERKGYDRQTIARAHEELSLKGASQGIVFNFEKVVLANTFNAHRVIHFARESGKQDEAHDILFRAYFTDGANVDDHDTLLALGEEIGLDTAKLGRILPGDAFSDAVRADITEAKSLGIEAVPDFLFNRNHEVIGAEGSALLLQTLETAFGEWEQGRRG